MMKVLVTGATGQLGTAIVREFGGAHRVLARSSRELDLTRADDVREQVRREGPDVVVNCAAYNEVDRAEDEPGRALAVNAFGTRALARAADAVGARFVHYSSDFVFDGMADRPYTERDTPRPCSAYAMSKRFGDWFARDARRHYVLRVESLFGGSALGSWHKSSVDRIADGLLEGREVPVFTDRTVSPSFVADVARATRRLLDLDAAPGLYHCVNAGSCTWLELAEELARALAVAPKLRPVRVADIPLRAARPKYCVLSNAKLAAAGVPMPTWQDALARYVALRTAGNS